MRHEVAITIIDKSYVDVLIVALVRQGYEVYYNDDEGCVCFLAEGKDIGGNKDEEEK